MKSRLGRQSYAEHFVRKRLRPNTLLKALSGTPVLWLLLRHDGSSARAIHNTFAHQSWNNHGGVREKTVLVGGFLLGIPVKLVLAGVYARRCGRRVRREVGKGLLRQWCEQAYLAVIKGVPPPWYYMFELYKDSHRAHALHYLYRAETKSGIYQMLRAQLPADNSLDTLSDKQAFAQHCNQHHLPVIAVVAAACKGDVESSAGGRRLPPINLFFKPRRGAGGRGASRWRYDGVSSYAADDGSTVSEAELVQYLGELSQQNEYIVRPWVVNHRDLIDIAGGALSTIRVLTCLDKFGQPVVTHAVIRMARHNHAVVDNFHAGGLAAKVDIDQGIVGEATDMGLRGDSVWHTDHPGTGAQITGRKLPYWNAVTTLARQAHQAFADQIAIGWDIAILDDGPFLLEGNKGPDFDIIQRVYRQPVGNAMLGNLLAYHLHEALSVPKIH